MRASKSRLTKLWKGALCALAIVGLLLPAVASAQTGGVGGRVLTPSSSNPRAQSIFIYTLKHGEATKDKILVINQSESEKTISLGSVDGVTANAGAYTCRQEAEPVKDSGGWVTLAKTKLTLPAGGKEAVDFTVTVPQGADVGEHNSCITIQADEASEAHQGVRLRMRQAVRMIVTVPGELRRSISIDTFSVTARNGKQRYEMAVANKGNVSADVDMKARMATLFGEEVASVVGEYPVIADKTLTQYFASDFAPLFGGWYTVTPSVRYDQRLGAFGTKAADAKYETKIGESVMIFLWPTSLGWLMIAGVLVLAAGMVALLRHHRGKAGTQKRPAKTQDNKG